MPKFNVPTNGIAPKMRYIVKGTQSVIYNGSTITTGNTFLGVSGVASFTYTGSGTQEVQEVTEIDGFAVEYVQNGTDIPVFSDTTLLRGFNVEFVQNANDIVIIDVTDIKGFNVEFVDFPIYAFQILTRRL